MALLQAGFLGAPVVVEGSQIHIYPRDKVEELATRPNVDLDKVQKSDLGDEQILVLRVTEKCDIEFVDSEEENSRQRRYRESEEEHSQFFGKPPRKWAGWSQQGLDLTNFYDSKKSSEHRDAVQRWYRLSNETASDIEARVKRLGYQPLVLTFKSLVIAGANASIEYRTGTMTSFQLNQPGPWYQQHFEDKWLRTRRGGPWILEHPRNLR